MNEQRKVVYCNEAASSISEMSIRKITRDRIFTEVLLFEIEKDILSGLENIHDPTPYKELNFSSSEGKKGRAQITIQKSPFSQDPQHWIIFFRDVTLEETLQKKYRGELEQKENYIKELQNAKLQLENYSTNLEKMVLERTQEIQDLNQTMTGLLNSLEQGFFLFDRAGLCQKVASRFCQNTLGQNPINKNFADLFSPDESAKDSLLRWIDMLFLEPIPFDDLAALGPQSFPHPQGLSISMKYYPLRNESGSLEYVIVVTSDLTALIDAQKEVEYEKKHAKMILSVVRHQREAAEFAKETQILLQSSMEMAYHKNISKKDELYRYLHTIKGGAASFSIANIVEAAHSCEEAMPKPEDSNWTPLKNKLIQLEMEFEKFLIECRETLSVDLLDVQKYARVPMNVLEDIVLQTYRSGNKSLSEQIYQGYILEPMKNLFLQYDDIIKETASVLNKKMAPLTFDGSELRIWKEPYLKLIQTFVHAFRNCVDHGIEEPEVRTMLGKSEYGNIRVYFSLINNQSTLRFQIQDDGQGIDLEKLKARLLKKGIDVSGKSDFELIQHVFDSELSTKDDVSLVSGRGVGMDAILDAATQLGGAAWVESKKGQGTTLTVDVPWMEHPKVQEVKVQRLAS